MNTSRKMTAHKYVDTGGNERPSVCSLRVLGKIPRVALK